MRGMWGRETRDVILVAILRWGAHPNWYFGISPSKLCKIWILWQTSPATSVQVNLAPAMIGYFFSSEKEKVARCSSQILLIPPVLQGPSTCPGSFIYRISNGLFKQHEPFVLFSIFLIDLYNFPPPILTPLYHPIPFDLELCLLGSASCERKETSMPSSWPRVSRRMISKPCWAETWTWMRHRGEETGFGFWF